MWSDSRLSHFNPTGKARSTNWIVGWGSPQGRHGCCENEKNLLCLSGIKPRFHGCAARILVFPGPFMRAANHYSGIIAVWECSLNKSSKQLTEYKSRIASLNDPLQWNTTNYIATEEQQERTNFPSNDTTLIRKAGLNEFLDFSRRINIFIVALVSSG